MKYFVSYDQDYSQYSWNPWSQHIVHNPISMEVSRTSFIFLEPGSLTVLACKTPGCAIFQWYLSVWINHFRPVSWLHQYFVASNLIIWINKVMKDNAFYSKQDLHLVQSKCRNILSTLKHSWTTQLQYDSRFTKNRNDLRIHFRGKGRYFGYFRVK